MEGESKDELRKIDLDAEQKVQIPVAEDPLNDESEQEPLPPPLTLRRFVVLTSLSLLWLSAVTPVFFIAASFCKLSKLGAYNSIC